MLRLVSATVVLVFARFGSEESVVRVLRSSLCCARHCVLALKFVHLAYGRNRAVLGEKPWHLTGGGAVTGNLEQL